MLFTGENVLGFRHDKCLVLAEWLKVKVTQSCLTLCDPMDYNPWNSPGQNTGVGSHPLLQGIFPNPGIKPRSPALQVDSLPAESHGKPYISDIYGICFSLSDFTLYGQSLGLNLLDYPSGS